MVFRQAMDTRGNSRAHQVPALFIFGQGGHGRAGPSTHQRREQHLRHFSLLPLGLPRRRGDCEDGKEDG